MDVKAWSDSVDTINPHIDPAKREWFAGECAKVGLRTEDTPDREDKSGDPPSYFVLWRDGAQLVQSVARSLGTFGLARNQ